MFSAIPSSSRKFDRLLNSSWGHQAEYARVTVELEVLKRPIFKPTLSTIMVHRVKGSLLANAREPWQRNAIYIYVFLGYLSTIMKKEGKKKGRRLNMNNIPKIAIFLTYFKNDQHNNFCGAWSLVLVHVRYT